MAYSLSRRHSALGVLVALAACPEPCPEDQIELAPLCAPVDRGTIALANPSFELPSPLAGWALADGPDVTASTIRGVDGCAAVSLARPDGEPIAAAARFTHTLDAADLRGQRVRLSLWARVDGDKKAHPTIALRASAGSRRALTDMRTAKLRGEGWRMHTVELDVPPTSDRLHLVVGLGGARRVDVDGVVLDRVGPACPGCDPPAPLSDQDLEHLSALTKLFGHVRYFYAGPESQHVDWDRLALAGVQAALAADHPAELAAAFERLFAPIAPRLQWLHGDAPPPPIAPRRPLVLVRRNDGQRSALFPRTTLAAELPSVSALPDTDSIVTLDLVPGLRARLPLALDADPDDLTKVVAPAIPLDKPPLFEPDLGDRVTRLAAIVLLGARLAHFSGRLDRSALEPILKDSFRRAATASDRFQLRAVVFRIFAAVGETTARAHLDDDVALFYGLAARWTWLDGQLVITTVDERAPGLQPGDVVEAIDGRATAAVLADLRDVSWGTTEARRMMIAASLARRGSGTPIGLQVRRVDGSEHHVAVRFAHNGSVAVHRRPGAFVDLDGGLLYVDLHAATPAELRAAALRLATTHGLLLDVRGGIEPDMLDLFRATLGDVGGPAPRHVIWPNGQPNPLTAPRARAAAGEPLTLPTQLAVLVDGNTQGRGEALADALHHHRGALLVGQPTVGGPDEPNGLALPGGLHVYFSEDPYRYASGHPSFAPLQPDITVRTTREAIAAGRDHILEQAAAALRRAP